MSNNIEKNFNKPSTTELIDTECENIKNMLIRKNKAYGNSFMYPINIFSQAPAIEQIRVRIDDKLNRLKYGINHEDVPEDTILDLIGYLILMRILKEVKE